jgi:hypothetical protein
MIVSCTITDNRQHVIADALRSIIDHVDKCIVIDTGVTDRTLEVADEVAGKKLVVSRFTWVDDFSAARNFGLDAAHHFGADLALNVDTDERWEWNGDDLALYDAPVLMVPTRGGTHVKEHVFRLPRQRAYSGRVHECYPSDGAVTMQKARVWELPKDGAGNQAKYERDLRILEGQEVKDSRCWFYLGQTLDCLGRPIPERIAAFQKCYQCDGWDEESAWACFLCAELSLQSNDPAGALRWALNGLGRHAGIGEMYWIAGLAQYRRGQWQQAVYWARQAVSMGCYQGHGTQVPRIGFRKPACLYENPFDLLHWGLKQLGRHDEAAQMLVLHESARLERLTLA